MDAKLVGNLEIGNSLHEDNFCFALIYFIYPFSIKKKESREGEGSKASIETMYSNYHTYILP